MTRNFSAKNRPKLMALPSVPAAAEPLRMSLSDGSRQRRAAAATQRGRPGAAAGALGPQASQRHLKRLGGRRQALQRPPDAAIAAALTAATFAPPSPPPSPPTPLRIGMINHGANLPRLSLTRLPWHLHACGAVRAPRTHARDFSTIERVKF